MNKNSPILVVGHNDVIENSLFARLQSSGYPNVISSSEIQLDVFSPVAVSNFFAKVRPEYVFLGSTRSGGIEANRLQGADFMFGNLMSQANIIHAAYQYKAEKLMFFSSSCVYPRESRQPIKEEYLLTGALEPTSEPYAVAKIAGIRMCQAYRRQHGLKTVVVIPATIYGPGSDVDLESAHVLGALIVKFHDAVYRGKKEVTVWGTGKPKREFLFAEDFVDAALFLMEQHDGSDMINAGCGQDVSIKELAETIAKVCGFHGKIVFDSSKPDGVMRKLLDSSRVRKLGWKPRVPLAEGIQKTFQWYLNTRVRV